MTGARPRLLLVYQRTDLPWVFEAAVRARIDLVLVPRPGGRVTAPPAGVVGLLPLDLAEEEAALAALADEHRRRPFDGVMTLFDPAVPFAARVAARLGLPGLQVETALLLGDKRRTRAALAAGGCNSPGFIALDDPAGWRAAREALRFPVVVKPSNGFSSLGVTRVDDPDELERAVAEVWEIGAAHSPFRRGAGVVVEEYLDGPEYAVESLVVDGAVHVLTIGDKGRPEGPYFEEGVYLAPARLSPEAVRAVVEEVVRAHRVLGVASGPTHTELRLCAGDRPFLLEMGARVGGSGVSHHIVSGVTGIDFAAAALRLAVGLPPGDLAGATPGGLASAQGCAANYIVPCGGSGVIAEISGLDDVRHDPRVDHVIQMLGPGDVVSGYPRFSGYPAFVLSRHDGYDDALGFHAELRERIKIAYSPLPEAVAPA